MALLPVRPAERRPHASLTASIFRRLLAPQTRAWLTEAPFIESINDVASGCSVWREWLRGVGHSTAGVDDSRPVIRDS